MQVTGERSDGLCRPRKPTKLPDEVEITCRQNKAHNQNRQPAEIQVEPGGGIIVERNGRVVHENADTVG